MSKISRPVLYNPFFGNDNGAAATHAVDIAAFQAPELRLHPDAAAAAPHESPADHPARTIRR